MLLNDAGFQESVAKRVKSSILLVEGANCMLKLWYLRLNCKLYSMKNDDTENDLSFHINANKSQFNNILANRKNIQRRHYQLL